MDKKQTSDLDLRLDRLFKQNKKAEKVFVSESGKIYSNTDVGLRKLKKAEEKYVEKKNPYYKPQKEVSPKKPKK